MYVYVFICMYMYVYANICMRMYVYIHACICVYLHVSVCMCMYVCAYVCICKYMYVYICICMCLDVFICLGMCYIAEAGKSALGVFVMLDEAGISALGGKRVKLHTMLLNCFIKIQLCATCPRLTSTSHQLSCTGVSKVQPACRTQPTKVSNRAWLKSTYDRNHKL